MLQGNTGQGVTRVLQGDTGHGVTRRHSVGCYKATQGRVLQGDTGQGVTR